MFEREFGIDVGKIFDSWKKGSYGYYEAFKRVKKLHDYFKKREEEYLNLTTNPTESDLIWKPPL